MRIKGSHLKIWILESDYSFSSLSLILYEDHVLLMFVTFRLVDKKNRDENGTNTVN